MFLLPLFVLSLLLLSIQTYSLSTCNPFQCGDHNFSYPFSLYEENTREYCGLPGLLISCEDHKTPILHMKSERYKVLDINYVNSTVTLVDTHILENASCPRVQNVSLFTDSGVFTYYSDSYSSIIFYFGCNVPNPVMYGSYSVSCFTDAENGSSYVLPSDLYFLDFSPWCQSVVEVPVLENYLQRYNDNIGTAFGKVLQHGFELGWDINSTNDCIQCERSNGLCGYILSSDTSFYKFSCINCPNGSCDHKSHFSRLATGTIGACLIAALLAFCCFLYYASKNKMICFSMKEKEMEKLVQVTLESFGSLSPKRYSFSEIRRITKSYNHKIGQGGYASVFKGELVDGTPVAVKLFKDRESTGEEFTSEVVSIARTSHLNIVRLLGFSIKGSKRALIYEFMQNGSLDKYLQENQNSTLRYVECTRLFHIAVGIARGLEYLHRDCNTRIVHFDIKPHNILLDQEYCPKVSDFGLAKFCQPKESILSMSGLRGTIGYIAPEVFSRNFGVVSSKSDVYSYGMMVLEMFGGKQAKMELINSSSDTYFHDCIYKCIEQNNICSIYGVPDESEEIVRKVMIIGLCCIQMLPHARPTMSTVLAMLDKNIEELALPPPLNVSLPPVLHEVTELSESIS